MNTSTDNRKKLLSYRRTPIEVESPEQCGYTAIACNLAESAVTDMRLNVLDLAIDIPLSYTDHRGNPKLRELIGGNLDADNILITAGASAALFITATSLLAPGDHAIVLHPNYVTNIETPRAIGCCIDYVRLSFENRFQIDMETLEQLIKPDTRLVSITYPHNPTGMTLPESELKKIVSLVESACDGYLLVDETYKDMAEPLRPPAASLSSRVISVSSVSKSYGLPGIRIGWLIAQDITLMETFLAAKEQIFICNSVIDEYCAHQVLEKRDTFLQKIKKHVKTNFEILKSWIDDNEYMDWVEPTGGCVCFPRLHGAVDTEKFYTILNQKYKTFVGPGHWFEMDDHYLRIGYGWPSKKELSKGLHCITKALKEVEAV